MTETEAKKRLARIAGLAQEGLHEYYKGYYDTEPEMEPFRQILASILRESEYKDGEEYD